MTVKTVNAKAVAAVAAANLYVLCLSRGKQSEIIAQNFFIRINRQPSI